MEPPEIRNYYNYSQNLLNRHIYNHSTPYLQNPINNFSRITSFYPGNPRNFENNDIYPPNYPYSGNKISSLNLHELNNFENKNENIQSNNYS